MLPCFLFSSSQNPLLGYMDQDCSLTLGLGLTGGGGAQGVLSNGKKGLPGSSHVAQESHLESTRMEPDLQSVVDTGEGGCQYRDYTQGPHLPTTPPEQPFLALTEASLG